MMQDYQPHTDAAKEIRRLDQQADHLEHLGQHDEATELRQMAAALAEAEAQRLAALADVYTQVNRFTERLRYAWETIDPRDSFNWFVEHSDDPEVVELRVELKRQKARILILEAARA